MDRLASETATPMLLAIDNSNHTTKFALADGSGNWVPGSRQRLPSAGLDVDGMLAAIARPSDITALAWASVTRDGPAVMTSLAQSLGVPSRPVNASTVPLDLHDYASPETIGPDRLANVVAAAARFPGRPVIAIDAGTAITFNAARPGDSHPVFLGGAIAPGLGFFTRWLASETDRLPEFSFPGAPPPAIGGSTLAALSAAAWHGAAGMLREILARQIEALGGQPAIVVTGSDADRFASFWSPSPAVDPMLTLDGIRLTSAHHATFP